DPRVAIADECHRAAEALRTRYEFGATPFSYVSNLSPYLNLYCEPPEFLSTVEHAPFEPLAFWGALQDQHALTPRRDQAAGGPPARRLRHFPSEPAGKPILKVYAAFGTIIWRYFAAEALAVLAALANHIAERDDACAIISLGGHAAAEETAESL